MEGLQLGRGLSLPQVTAQQPLANAPPASPMPAPWTGTHVATGLSTAQAATYHQRLHSSPGAVRGMELQSCACSCCWGGGRGGGSPELGGRRELTCKV